MSKTGYQQFCPVAMASEILCTRWTIVLLRELLAGSTRFNDLRRGVPRMSPALLSKRLRDLEGAGIVERVGPSAPGGAREYALTQAGRDLGPVIESIGVWGARWIHSEVSLAYLDAQLLMWDMRRNIRAEPLPPRRTTVLFTYPEQEPALRKWWLIVQPDGETDLCSVDPGFDVDLYVTTDLRTMTGIWMGLTRLGQARREDRISIIGDRAIEDAMPSWLGFSPFARIERHVA